MSPHSSTSAKIFFVLMFVFLLTGCGNGLVDVGGSVTLDGEPLHSGTVVFVNGERAMAVGAIDESGSYAMRTGEAWGVAPGSYSVTISAFRTRAAADGSDEPIPEFLTPVKYNLPTTSGLTAGVDGDHHEFDFDLVSPLVRRGID